MTPNSGVMGMNNHAQILFSETGSPTALKLTNTRLVEQNSRALRLSSTGITYHAWILCGSCVLNSSSYAFIEGALLTGPFPSASIACFYVHVSGDSGHCPSHLTIIEAK